MTPEPARRPEPVELDAADRRIVNRLQDGLPLVASPYAAVAAELSISEGELLYRLERLLEAGVLSRFGPMYHAERLGGGLTLAALEVPEADYERVTAAVNAFPEVAHNYRREHRLNMWFVLATETPERIDEVIAAIEAATGLAVFNMPKQEEFHVRLHLPV
ncbi:AsnC family transcriptional regulator [Halomonas sp. MCCC 1A11057]|jgi:DNA-binding Lrp family transcriptional regulator|uniref:Lrp/AsnC family transcriptional regulator n=1 Tax=Halomonas sp. MCCC 1A11057 TaxID=2733482 RepID=UPI001F2B5F4F|nr:AsnC family transcriptional regulator [Halomonas sp. MCCC 1A11057]MCE8034990.1 Lrp/AsnC family transcriptional regulator [Halomonas sp. MCCC 1A11057]